MSERQLLALDLEGIEQQTGMDISGEPEHIAHMCLACAVEWTSDSLSEAVEQLDAFLSESITVAIYEYIFEEKQPDSGRYFKIETANEAQPDLWVHAFAHTLTVKHTLEYRESLTVETIQAVNPAELSADINTTVTVKPTAHGTAPQSPEPEPTDI